MILKVIVLDKQCFTSECYMSVIKFSLLDLVCSSGNTGSQWLDQVVSLRLKEMEEGVVESATTISLPSTSPSSARVSFKFFLVASSMLATDCM